MANQRDIKRRITSVANTQKITKAMKLVSAAKFARASHAVSAARPYSTAIDQMVQRLIGKTNEPVDSKLVQERPQAKLLVVVVATDRGLCGALNANLFKQVKTWAAAKCQPGIELHYAALGRKAASWAKKQPGTIAFTKEKVTEKPSFYSAKIMAEKLTQLFVDGEFDGVYIAYNVFQNALTQTAVVKQFLPVTVDKQQEAPVGGPDYILEPGLDQMVDDLLERKIAILLFQAFLDAAASEHGSRMTAMDNATNNAGEVRKKLTLKYNRARQASITKELIEIVSGAEAL